MAVNKRQSQLFSTLRFSWGHIIAFIALVLVSYLTFMGAAYFMGGDFWIGLATMGGIDALLLTLILVPQLCKASPRNFQRNIKWERFLIFGSPVIFIIAMLPALHFWTVHARNQRIVDGFTSSINASRQVFTDFDAYANARLEAYAKQLDADPNLKPYQRQNMLETLRLQLLSDNFSNLHTDANAWIDRANQGASTWNVFLLGNIEQIRSAIEGWDGQLRSSAMRRMSNEASTTQFDSQGGRQALQGLDNLDSDFTQAAFPPILGIVCILLIYVMLMTPYMIQVRNPKSHYTLRHDPPQDDDDGWTGTETGNSKGKEVEIPTPAFKVDERYKTF